MKDDQEVNTLKVLANEAKTKLWPRLTVWGMIVVGAVAATRIMGRPEGPCIDGFASATLDPETNKITVIASYDKNNVPSPEVLIGCALKTQDVYDLDDNFSTSTVGKAVEGLGLLGPVTDYMGRDAIVRRSPVSAEVIVNFPPRKVFDDILNERKRMWWENAAKVADIALDGVAALGALWLVLKARSFRRSLRG